MSNKWEDASDQLQDFFDNPMDIVNGNLFSSSHLAPRKLAFDVINTSVKRDLSQIEWGIQFLLERSQ